MPRMNNVPPAGAMSDNEMAVKEYEDNTSDKAPEGEGMDAGVMNPVIDALKVLQAFAVSQSEQGNTKIEEALKTFLMSLSTPGGKEEKPAPQPQIEEQELTQEGPSQIPVM